MYLQKARRKKTYFCGRLESHWRKLSQQKTFPIAVFWMIVAETACSDLSIFSLENKRKSSQIFNDDCHSFSYLFYASSPRFSDETILPTTKTILYYKYRRKALNMARIDTTSALPWPWLSLLHRAETIWENEGSLLELIPPSYTAAQISLPPGPICLSF
jgi:hypothetical protein